MDTALHTSPITLSTTHPVLSRKTFRVAIAQITTDPGRIQENTVKIVSAIEQAKAGGAEVVVFPELTIPGYASMDLFFNKDYIQDNLAALDVIKKATTGITAIVGHARLEPAATRPGSRPALYNSAAVLRDGVLVATQDKELLPNYNIFFEDRYFNRATERRVVTVGGINLGIQICEDLWNEGYKSDPTHELASLGADIIINLSASPFHLGKLTTRASLIGDATKRTGLPVIYANLVGSFDGYEGEVVFDGRSLVMDGAGEVKALGRSFSEDLVFADVQSKSAVTLPTINRTEELYNALVLGVKDYFRRLKNATQINLAIVGVSGGIDSAVVAAIAADALGPKNVLGISMPSKFSSPETKADAELLAETLGINFKTIPIGKQLTVLLEEFCRDPQVRELLENVAEENVQARLRMLILMFFANKLGGLVLNTGNKTELALDNCTIYGDMVGGFSVLGDVDKDRVYDLARFINERAAKEIIPLTTIDRIPSAELKADQKDSDVMGGDPQTIAPAIRRIVEEGMTFREACRAFAQTYPEPTIRKWFKRLDSSEWKRRQAAPAIRVTPLAFGNGRRMPMNHGYL